MSTLGSEPELDPKTRTHTQQQTKNKIKNKKTKTKTKKTKKQKKQKQQKKRPKTKLVSPKLCFFVFLVFAGVLHIWGQTWISEPTKHVDLGCVSVQI